MNFENNFLLYSISLVSISSVSRNVVAYTEQLLCICNTVIAYECEKINLFGLIKFEWNLLG